MVYKYWDCESSRFCRQGRARGVADFVSWGIAITKEDLEFSVGSKASVWEVKDPLLPVSFQPFSGRSGAFLMLFLV